MVDYRLQSKSSAISCPNLREELEKLTEGVDFLIFPPELNAAERKHAHEAGASRWLGNVGLAAWQCQRCFATKLQHRMLRAGHVWTRKRDAEWNPKLFFKSWTRPVEGPLTGVPTGGQVRLGLSIVGGVEKDKVGRIHIECGMAVVF